MNTVDLRNIKLIEEKIVSKKGGYNYIRIDIGYSDKNGNLVPLVLPTGKHFSSGAEIQFKWGKVHPKIPVVLYSTKYPCENNDFLKAFKLISNNLTEYCVQKYGCDPRKSITPCYWETDSVGILYTEILPGDNELQTRFVDNGKKIAFEDCENFMMLTDVLVRFDHIIVTENGAFLHVQAEQINVFPLPRKEKVNVFKQQNGWKPIN